MAIDFGATDDARNGDSSYINCPANYAHHYRQGHHHDYFRPHYFGCAYFDDNDNVNWPGIHDDTPSSVCQRFDSKESCLFRVYTLV